MAKNGLPKAYIVFEGENETLTCAVCFRNAFKDCGSLTKHYTAVHYWLRAYKCGRCDFEENNFKKMANHLRTTGHTPITENILLPNARPPQRIRRVSVDARIALTLLRYEWY